MEEACKLGDIDTVKEIVRGDPHLIWQAAGRAGLTWASYCGHANVVHYLLVSGAEPDFVDEAMDGSAFHAACKTGHLDVFFLLLERKADPCKPTLTGAGPLTLACRGGHASIVRVLLGIPEVDMNEKDAEGYSALWWAVYYGHTHVVKLLLDKGADWKATKEGGKRPLELARLKKNAGCLRLLVAMDRAERREARRIYLMAKARQILDDRHHVACTSRQVSRDEESPIQRSHSFASLSASSVSSCVSQPPPSPERSSHSNNSGSVPPHLTARVAQGLALPVVKIGVTPGKQVTNLMEKMWRRLHSPQLKKRHAVPNRPEGVVKEVVRRLSDDVFWDLMGYLSGQDVAI